MLCCLCFETVLPAYWEVGTLSAEDCQDLRCLIEMTNRCGTYIGSE